MRKQNSLPESYSTNFETDSNPEPEEKAQPETEAILDFNEVDDEKPLLTSSPALSSFRKQPEALKLASNPDSEPDMSVTEEENTEEDTDKFLEAEQNLPKPYFMAPKKNTLHQPTLSPIASSRTEKFYSAAGSNTANSNTLLVESSEAATLKGQASLETDVSSRTLLGHNDTLDNSDFSDISFDH